MRVIVTGGAGFIGSNLVDDSSVARGDEVTVLDDLSTGRASNLDDAIERGAKLVVLDIRNSADLDGAFGHARPEAVLHLAAQIDVRRSIAAPAWDAAINIEGTINVLEAARVHGVRRIVNSSTGGAIYGDADAIPTPEDQTALPEAAYGQSKLGAEGYVGLYERLYGLDTVTLRYGNVYGPRQDPLGEAGVIAIFCRGAHAGRAADDLRRRHADARLRLRGRRRRRQPRRARVPCARAGINIGTGVETSVLDAGRGARRGSRARRASSRAVRRRGAAWASSLAAAASTWGRALELLGWSPSVSIREGLRSTLDAARAAAPR